jgi:FKBP-type peptidyl-prolyl cis-trans isomerase
VRTLKHFWQSLTQRITQHASRRAGELERELSAARLEQQTLLGEFTGLQAHVEHELSATRQEKLNLLEQLTGLQADFERELSAANVEKHALLGQLTGLQADIERLRSRDEQLFAELGQQLHEIQTERNVEHQRVEALRTALADAASREEQTETRVNKLEIRLREQHREHQAALQESQDQERRQARRLNVAMTVAGAAFALGIVGSATNFWEVRSTARLLAEVSQGIKNIQTAMGGYPAGHMQTPSREAPASPIAEPSRAKIPESVTSTVSGSSREATDANEWVPAQILPEPDFIASRSLPLSEHMFNNRQDAHTFFEENARQPGVVTLPSGLQYRVLIPGTGKPPRSSDEVVVEYRAFRPDGTELDNSFKEDLPTTFTVNEAIPALKEALQHMEVGAQWELYIPPALAYKGVRKRGPRGFEPLIMTVELISVVSPETSNKR